MRQRSSNRKSLTILARVAAAAAAALLSVWAPAALGQGVTNATWQAPNGLSGSWVVTAHWDTGIYPDGVGASATFKEGGTIINPGGTRNVTLDIAGVGDSNITISSLSVTHNGSGATTFLDGTAGSQMVWDAVGTATVPVTVSALATLSSAAKVNLGASNVFNDMVEFNMTSSGAIFLGSQGSALLGGPVSGPGGFRKTGPGRMTMDFTSGNSTNFKTYTGPTEITNGRLRMSVGSRPLNTSGVSVTGEGQLDLFQDTAAYNFGVNNNLVLLTLNGIGPSTGPDVSFGAIRPSADLNIVLPNRVFLPGTVTTNNPTGTAGVHSRRSAAATASSITFQNAITGPGSLTFSPSAGNGLNGNYNLKSTASTYSGGTIVNGGTLDATTGNLGATTGPLTVNVENTAVTSTTVLLNTSSPTTTGTLSGTKNGSNNPITINAASQLFTVNQTSNATYEGQITGTGGFRLGPLSSRRLTLSEVQSYTGGTTVDDGTLEVRKLHAGNGVTINGGLLRVLHSAPTGAHPESGDNAFVSQPSSLTISTGGGGALDLTNNDLILDYSGPSPIATYEALVASGYDLFNGGGWTGLGITSSTAAADGNFALGVADNAALAAPFGSAQGGPLFSGVDVDLTTVLVKFTHRADVNLDGVITPDDSAIFGGNYDESITSGFTWAKGDMNYDGMCTPDDAAIFGGAYDESLTSLPEPVSAGARALACLALCPRRRPRGVRHAPGGGGC